MEILEDEDDLGGVEPTLVLTVKHTIFYKLVKRGVLYNLSICSLPSTDYSDA